MKTKGEQKAYDSELQAFWRFCLPSCTVTIPHSTKTKNRNRLDPETQIALVKQKGCIWFCNVLMAQKIITKVNKTNKTVDKCWQYLQAFKSLNVKLIKRRIIKKSLNNFQRINVIWLCSKDSYLYSPHSTRIPTSLILLYYYVSNKKKTDLCFETN